ncbi:Glutaredoxin [Desulfosarcina cetonica]|uniref:glutaredoxin family protein n=1 Tax=Desulfosarcina cetonica TaxID=90730 RepID=UPI0006CF5F6E|nr:glutaredoxin family protein [Desulfosarcina cetonica]VTR67741.1 Glutaredoxin [Desulfosarcina cetonica]
MPYCPEAKATLITLYGLQTCGHCKSVRKLLRERRVPFRTILVDMLIGESRNDTLRQLKRMNPTLSFPMLIVGNQTIVGFKPADIENALAALPKQ